MTTVLASAADAAYGYHLVNLLGSVQANSPVFDAIVVHDLGLTPHQRQLVGSLRGVEVREMPRFSPHWAQGFTWKPWIWTHLEADVLFYLDAGATVLRSLEPALEQASETGSFLVSQGGRLDDILPPGYFTRYQLDPALAARPYAAAGILALRTGGPFWDEVVRPTYEDCLAGLNLGFSADDARRRNSGLAFEESPVIHDCRHFRWDQTVLNAHVAKRFPDAPFADMAEYAGVRTPREHPRQVIWAHRRNGSLRYMKRAAYTDGALRARTFGAWFQIRWWIKLHDKYLRRSTYVWKARKTIATLRSRRRS